MTGSPDRQIDYLSATPARTEILERLVDDAVQPATLVEFAGVSRTTVHRTLNELVERRWVRRVDDGYTATGAGALALETYLEARAQFRTIERLTPVLSRIEPSVFSDVGESRAGLDAEWLETAAVAAATEANPQLPIEWYADRLEATAGDRLRGLSPTINRQFMAVHGPIVAETPTELVVDESTFRMVREEYPDTLRRSLSAETYALYVANERVSVGITLYGETVFLGVYNGAGGLFAVLESTDSRLWDWSETVYSRYRESARRITRPIDD